jgi:transposase
MKELLDLKQLTDSDKGALIQTLWDKLQKLQEKKPRKTSKNSSLPPAQGFKAAVSEPSGSKEIERSASVARVGGGRKLSDNPDQIIRADSDAKSHELRHLNLTQLRALVMFW